MPIIIVVVLVVIAGAGAAFFVLDTDSSEVKEEVTAVEETTEVSTFLPETTMEEMMEGDGMSEDHMSQMMDGDFKNGFYYSESTYTVPSGHEEAIKVQINLTDDKIRTAKIDFEGIVGTSRLYQKRFSNEFESVVVGKEIADLDLARVGGASLTTKAFNKALEEVRQQAKS